MKTKKSGTGTITVLAVVCWMIPLAGFAYDFSNWWMYLVWLVIGTVILSRYVENHE